jgi:hypothetical protein
MKKGLKFSRLKSWSQGSDLGVLVLNFNILFLILELRPFVVCKGTKAQKSLINNNMDLNVSHETI